MRSKYEMNCGQNEKGPLPLTALAHAHEKSRGVCTTLLCFLLPDVELMHSR